MNPLNLRQLSRRTFLHAGAMPAVRHAGVEDLDRKIEDKNISDKIFLSSMFLSHSA